MTHSAAKHYAINVGDTDIKESTWGVIAVKQWHGKELEGIREAARVGREVLDAAHAAVAPGTVQHNTTTTAMCIIYYLFQRWSHVLCRGDYRRD